MVAGSRNAEAMINQIVRGLMEQRYPSEPFQNMNPIPNPSPVQEGAHGLWPEEQTRMPASPFSMQQIIDRLMSLSRTPGIPSELGPEPRGPMRDL